MNTDGVYSYAALDAALAALPLPPPDRVRVLRGQPADYGVMRPTGFRRGAIPLDTVWSAYTAMLAATMPGEWRGADEGATLVWIRAVAQHYGPGSTLLDVTGDLRVALWFARHIAEEREVDSVPPLATALEDVRDFPFDGGNRALVQWGVTSMAAPTDKLEELSDRFRLRRVVLRSERIVRYLTSARPGYLYVFDVPRWSGRGKPRHGELVNLADAPAVFRQSERMRVQAGQLVAAEAATSGGDLSGFYACPPFKVFPEANEIAAVDLPAHAMFPDVSADPWYRRLLSIPHVIDVDLRDTQNPLRFARPLPAPVYESERSRAVPVVMLDPPLVHRAASAPAGSAEAIAWLSGGRMPEQLAWEEVTPIVLQSPLLATLPDPAGPAWNHGLLAADIADEIELPHKVPLVNVLFELSALEHADWHAVEDPRATTDVTRAIWILRRDERCVVHLFSQRGARGTLQSNVRMAYGFNGTLLHRETADGNWAPVDGKHPVDRALFLALALQRTLSPLAQANLFPREATPLPGGRWRFTVDLGWGAAQLSPVRGLAGAKPWYVMLDTARMSQRGGVISNEPFMLRGPAVLQSMTFESDVPWAAVDAAALRREVRTRIPRS